jgi:hypothetical protein
MNEHALLRKALQLRRLGIGFRRNMADDAGERSKEPALYSFRAKAEAVIRKMNVFKN